MEKKKKSATYGLAAAWRCKSWCFQLKPSFLRGWGTGEAPRPRSAGTAPSRESLHMETHTPQAWKRQGARYIPHYSMGIVRIWGAGWEFPCENPAGSVEMQPGAAKLSWWCLLLARIPYRGLRLKKKKTKIKQIQVHLISFTYLSSWAMGVLNSLGGFLKINRGIQLERVWNKQH